MTFLAGKRKYLIIGALIFSLWIIVFPAQASQLHQTGSQGDGATAALSATPVVTEAPQNTPSPTATAPLTPTETASTSTPTASAPTPTITATFTVSPSPTLMPTPLADSITATPTPSLTITPQPAHTSTISPPNDLPEDYVPNEVLIRVDPTSSMEELLSYLESINANITSEISGLGILKIEVSGGDIQKLVEELGSIPEVVYAEPNYYAQVLETNPNDPELSNQYGLGSINASQAWDLATGSVDVTIAILDTGVDQHHPDLSGKIVPGYDFIELDTDPQDDNGHGTHVAGIAAASTDNATGIAGISWGAQIMPIKILNSMGNGSYNDLAAGIIWATDHGAQVINLSLGGAYPSAVLEAAIDYAYSHGVVQVAASGNSGSGTVLYPAHYEHVVAVGATDSSNNHAGFSNYGPELAFVSPGVSIYSTMLGGGYGYRSGTSMSTPFISGLAAILVGVPRPYSPDLISYEMESTALDLGAPGQDNYYGYGLIQMDAALRLAIPTPTATKTREPRPTAVIVIPYATHSLTPTSTQTPTQTPTQTLTLTPVVRAASPTPGGKSPTYTEIPEEEKVVALGMDTPNPTATPQGTLVQKTPSASITSIPEGASGRSKAHFLMLGIVMVLSGMGLLGYGILLRKANAYKGE